MKEDRTVNREKSTEAEALMRIHGLSLKEACTVVGLEPERYWGTDAPLSAAPQHAGWRKPPGLARIPRQARSIRIQVLETPLRTVERLAKRLSQRERATFSTCGNAANRRPVRSGTR